MAIIITYDISNHHSEFKELMFDLGYTDKISGKKCKTIYFPNTSLYHSTKTSIEARADAQAKCVELKTPLVRFISTQWGEDWSAICGEPF